MSKHLLVTDLDDIVSEIMNENIVSSKYRPVLVHAALTAALGADATYRPDPESPGWTRRQHAMHEILNAVVGALPSVTRPLPKLAPLPATPVRPRQCGGGVVSLRRMPGK